MRFALVAVATVALGATTRPAAAQSQQPAMVSNVNLEASALLAVPGDDIADAVETSPGIRGGIGYHLNPNLSVHAAGRFIAIRLKDDVRDLGAKLTYFDVGAGGRYTHPVAASWFVAVDADILMSQVRLSGPPGSRTNRNPGIAARLSCFYALSQKLQLSAGGGVTKTFASGDGFDQDSRWLDIGIGALFYL